VESNGVEKTGKEGTARETTGFSKRGFCIRSPIFPPQKKPRKPSHKKKKNDELSTVAVAARVRGTAKIAAPGRGGPAGRK